MKLTVGHELEIELKKKQKNCQIVPDFINKMLQTK